MREIKFRAWDDLNKKWLMGYEYPNLSGFSLTGESILFGEWGDCFDQFIFNKDGKLPEHLIIEQFTGLKDKLGSDIYEGDNLTNNNHDVGTVVYYEYGFQLKCIRQNGDKFHIPLTKEFLYNKIITGDIHQSF